MTPTDKAPTSQIQQIGVPADEASVPNPKFAVSAATTGANFGFEGTLENYDSSVILVQKFS
jgi:hypothetical protein